MSIYQISGLEDSTAQKLKKIDSDKIIERLEQLVAAETSDDDSDELAEYSSVPEIMEDESLSQVEKRQLKIKAERRSDIKKR